MRARIRSINQREHEVRERAAELVTINRITQALATQLDKDSLIQFVGDQVRDLFRAPIAYVSLLDRSTMVLQFPYTFGEDAAPRPFGSGLTSQIIRTGQPLADQRGHGPQPRQAGHRADGPQYRLLSWSSDSVRRANDRRYQRPVNRSGRTLHGSRSTSLVDHRLRCWSGHSQREALRRGAPGKSCSGRSRCGQELVPFNGEPRTPNAAHVGAWLRQDHSPPPGRAPLPADPRR